ncbi:glycosyltransferase family 2 protein [Celeribacter sp. ULVN23_4]
MRETWQVACILKEDLKVTLRFVAWYLDMGADRVTLLFDDPNDPAIELLQDLPRVECLPCTEAFWKERIGVRPGARFTRRQNAALTHIYRNTEQDWLLNVDADELLYIDQGMDGFLAAQPEDVDYVRIGPVEKVLQEDEDSLCLRARMDKDALETVHGEEAKYFARFRRGMVGHPEGKSIIRAGLDVQKLRQHWPKPRDGEAFRERLVPASKDAMLIHLLGEDEAVWKDKIAWRMDSWGFAPAIKEHIQAALETSERDAALTEIYDAFFRADAAKLARLKEQGALIMIEDALDAPAKRLFAERML